jgi:hypothetical protein
VANSQRGEVALDVGGRTLTLVLDLNAMCELEELLSTPERPVSFADVATSLMASRMTYVRAFFWACLRRHHRDVTLMGVSDLMQDAGGIGPFMDKVAALMAMTQPDAEDAGQLHETNGRPTRAAQGVAGAGTGRRSIGKRAKSV